MGGEVETCPECGSELRVPKLGPPPNAANGAMAGLNGAQESCANAAGFGEEGNMTRNFSCPACGSERTQKVSVAYAAGTSTGRRTAGGFAFTADGLVPVIGGGNTQTRTSLAASLAPPVRRDDYMAWIILAGMVLGFAGGVFTFDSTDSRELAGAVFFLVVVFSIFVSWLARKWAMRYNTTVYRKALSRWQRSWFCHRCGARFEPGGGRT
jgi:DNA-directed RNA polymerase subunit RPC12/RpoP